MTVEVRDTEVTAALDALIKRVGNLRPFLMALGEDIMERTKRRFETSTRPDGQRWQANSQATILAYVAKKRGFGAKGINKRGREAAMGKKPLIGDSRDLSRQFYPSATDTSLTVTNTMAYAAMQHFGGKKSDFPWLWGDIPARPYFPVTPEGNLYPAEQREILDAISAYLEQG